LDTLWLDSKEGFYLNEDNQGGTIKFAVTSKDNETLFNTFINNEYTFYKAQLAYGKNRTAGFFSTVGVFKITDEPSIQIKNIN
jgi:hypothetical protein